MANLQPSPISQLLNSLGITREDLERRSDQMRQFLTSDSAISSRVSSHLPSSTAVSRASSSTAPFTRQISRGASISARDASPTPAPTIKPEPEEEPLPPRQFDNMEMVLERQRLNRKQKRSRKREPDPARTALPPSPPPSDASNSGAPNIPREDSRKLASSSSSSIPDRAPVTPMHSKYYREHTSYPDSDPPVIKTESSPSPTKNALASTSTSTSAYPYPYFYYSAYAAQNQFLTLPFRSAQASSSSSFKTPVKASRPARKSSPSNARSPLPPSSPPDASSPVSSPAVRLVNIVSSPGPLDELPDEPKAPPYALPPGPYSDQRPHHSYAALIGQAVLSSENHRLTLQEIYEWIATVYPHFKRGERTWMNSIRHVLSTTVHFRKISRERSAGRSHWAIFDEDLPCFADGGYKKPGATAKRTFSQPKAKKRSAKEVEEEDSPSTLAKKSAKRPKKTTTNPTAPFPTLPTSLFPISEQPPGLLPALIHPQEKPKARTGPATHHQTYYESCVSAPGPFVPSDIIFPPLPNSSYRLIASDVSSMAASASQQVDDEDVESEEELELGYPEPPSTEEVQPTSPVVPVSTPDRPPQSTPTRPSSPSPSSSLPALTPNCSSSSPIPASEMDQGSDEPGSQDVSKEHDEMPHFNDSVTVAGVDNPVEEEQPREENDFGRSLLRPVQFWDEPGPGTGDAEALQPGIELQESANPDGSDNDDDDVPLMLMSQTNKLMKKAEKTAAVKIKVKMPPAPTLQRRKTAAAARPGNKNGKRKQLKPSKAPVAAPSTPPRDNSRRKIHFSPSLYSSPSAKLAHHKSHLDPSPTLTYGAASSSRLSPEREDDDEPSDVFRTPARKRNAASSSAHPITPKRLLFGIDNSSPFRTPGGGTLSASPFRTPGGSRGGGIFDPHDPSALLDEELNNFGAAGSPAGLYGKGTLYDSPNPLDGSPGKWARWW
ncbi:hypothetical protein C8R45DRAFT_2943 [Mycena sanguinolenta]|nr:hypothetical protein C8R45DRAFT_2943 [Mycena sanguinolenta]